MFIAIPTLSIAFCVACGQAGRSSAERGGDGDVVILRDIAYREGGSRQWRLDLAVKKGSQAKPRPGIIVIHGGGWIEGDKSSFSQPNDDVPGNILQFAKLGFVAATINYRLSGEAPFPAALEDCRSAVRWLRAHAKEYHLDREHIGAFGNSAGGHLALLLAMARSEAGADPKGPFPDESSAVQSVVSDSGPIDLIEQYRSGVLRQVCASFMGGPPEGDRISAYKRASPCEYVPAADGGAPGAHRAANRAGGVAAGVPPLLLIYGVEDAQVPVQTADRFVSALDKAGVKDVSYYRLAKMEHCPYSLIRVPPLRPIVDQFFIRTLMQVKN
jgi:acetyl esterase/lipase